MRQINARAARPSEKAYMAMIASEKPQFYVVGLTEADIAPAFALIRAIAPATSLQQFALLAARRLAEGGMLGLFAQDGSLFGLLSWREEQRLDGRRVLAVDEFVTFELSRAAPGRKSLCEAAEQLAREKGCDVIEIRITGRGLGDSLAGRLQGWSSLGHRVESVLLVKDLERAGQERQAFSAAS